jgi:type IV pilus assembly protein PilY1
MRAHLSTAPRARQANPFRRVRAALGFGGVAVALLGASSDARAQSAGTANKPAPNILLLVDTSGSMERMTDNSLPSANKDPQLPYTTNTCSPGNRSMPNRWSMLVQSLTGSINPEPSCWEMPRTSLPATGVGSAFRNQYKIAGVLPYDSDYFLPHHRLVSGPAADPCVLMPNNLPGTGSGTGVGPGGAGATGGYNAEDFPEDAIIGVRYSVLKAALESDTAVNTSIATNLCRFDQAFDGQLDLARDFARFGLMTFDNAEGAGTGITGAMPGATVDTANPFLGQWSYVGPTIPNGFIPGCATPFVWELGARHAAAPPWEGRHIPFPKYDADLFEMYRVTENVQKVLLTTRPYGATPIDGMFYDAEHYLRGTGTSLGPHGTINPDPYVQNGCRDQNIILLSDGAPNLDLRPECAGPGGTCPYALTAAQHADQMFQASAATGQKVKTFVIGFSVNGAGASTPANDGFPGAITAPNNNCRGWFQSFGGDDETRTTAMQTFCSATPPPTGSTASACCKLNEIAYFGSGGTGPGPHVPPFFAETQRDLVLAFGRVLALIAKTATTRTAPGYSPTITTTVPATVQGNYVASFVPNAQKPWSGSLDRVRVSCNGIVPQAVTHTPSEGDSYAQNLEAQARGKRRFFITVKADATPNTGAIDSAGTIRPFTAATVGVDGIPDYKGGEVGGLQTSEDSFSTPLTPDAFEITNATCKRSKTPQDTVIPPLTAGECSSVAWNFMAAWPDTLNKGTPSHDFNTRCTSAATKRCSVSNSVCSLDTDCPTGEVCVPPCPALGGIFRSSPVVVGPPYSITRDDGYRGFEAARNAAATRRRTAMFVASTDGVLHAFDALGTVNGPGTNATPAVGTHRTNANEFEMWAFVPPAVLPRLASNMPSGSQILLDGTVAVQDTVWDRAPGVTNKNLWHTTLVAGLGTTGGGYYALNVSDVDCGGDTKFCGNAGAYQAPTANNLTEVSTGADTTNGSKAGPHFLWQLTDVPEKVGSEKAKPVRKDRDLPARDRVALFAQRTGTPAITTLYFDPTTVSATGPGTAPREIGVAILPGGIDGPPSTTATCGRDPRALAGGTHSRSDSTLPPRTSVRQWGKTNGSCPTVGTEPVPGRSLTLVRLDTGEIIRHFGRATQDVPQNLVGLSPPVVTDSPFDAPIIGTPAVYPAQVASLGRRIFVGDADGTIWRVNVASTNPNEWKVELFQDLYSGSLAGLPGPLDGQPIAVPLTVSTDPSGLLVINAATGDQDNIVYSPTPPLPGTRAPQHYVYSIREARDIAGSGQFAEVLWSYRFPNATGERVTGPMAVFDSKLYFATYLPKQPGGACTQDEAYIWGMNFTIPQTAGDRFSGGRQELCNDPIAADPYTAGAPAATCTTVQKLLAGNNLIPGVSILAQPTCSSLQTDSDFSGSGYSFNQQTSTQFKLMFGSGGAGGTAFPGVKTGAQSLATPKTPTTVDAWALVIE